MSNNQVVIDTLVKKRDQLIAQRSYLKDKQDKEAAEKLGFEPIKEAVLASVVLK